MLSLVEISEIVLLFAVLLLCAWRLAPYLVGVFKRSPTKIDRFFGPIESSIYRVLGIDSDHSMSWKEYFLSAVFLNIAQMTIAFFILVAQGVLPLNPRHVPSLSLDLAFNTVVSFGTNTNLQHYAGEVTLSYFSQMTAIQFLQFTSAATGLCAGVAMVRCFTTQSKGLGNFYVDFVRSMTRILIPLCFVASMILVWLGVPQSISGYTTVTTVEGATQSVLVGPVASLVSIMQLGNNGGGFYGANSAYPFQNPSEISNLVEIFLMLLIPTALCFIFGDYIGKKRESLPLIVGAYSLFAIDLGIAFIPNPAPIGPGLETRFGGFMSTFWTVVTTATSTGSLNSSLLGNHPLTILSSFLGMLIQATPGGNGVGLMYLLMYVVITVFIVGLMSGRTPEYLGIKLTGKDVRLVMIAFLIHPIIIIVPTVVSFAIGAPAAIGIGTNASGFTQILYEYTSSASNNGSDFLGTLANTPFFNVSTAIVIWLGRFAPMACLLALGASFLGRKRSSVTTSSLNTASWTFSVVLVASVLILVVLTFFPFLVLGPILSYFEGFSSFFG